MNGQQSGSNTGAMVAAGGGLLAVIGVFLPWASVSVSGAFADALPADSANGLSDWRGIVALIGGLLVAGAAFGIIAMKGGGSSKTMATLATVGGIVVVLAAILGYIGASQTGASEEEIAALEAFGASVDASAGLGVYLSAVGGLLGAIGGFMAKGKAGDGGGMGMTPPSAPAA